ncbi:MAG: AsmA family protein [Smithella sp.]|nr:AsmA family protein [Smithella sp.]
MNKMLKKVVWFIVVVIVVLIAAVIIGVRFFGGQALKKGIEYGGTTAMKVGVSLDDAKLSILGGNVELDGLKIQNPSGYQHPEFLTMGKAAVQLNIKSLLSETVEIDKIQLDQIQLTIEQKGLTTNNLQEILNSLPKSEGTAPQSGQSSSGKKLLIKELAINGVQVKAKLLPIPGKADTVTLKLNPIVMNDLGSDKPINTAELTSKIIKAIAGGVAEQGKDLLPLDMVNSIGSGFAEQGKEIIDKASKGVLEGVGEVGKGATDALKGIFQKKEQ